MAQINEHASAVVRELSNRHCSVVHLEKQGEEGKPEWGYFIDELKDGDVAVLYSFCNCFRSFTDMMYFLKLCSAKSIRIVSIHDELDSSDEMFSSRTADTLAAIAKVPNVKETHTQDDFESDMFAGSTRDRKLKKYRMIINLYNAGFTIDEILKKTGYTSKSTIYKVLHAYDVPMEYPAMSRSAKAEEVCSHPQ